MSNDPVDILHNVSAGLPHTDAPFQHPVRWDSRGALEFQTSPRPVGDWIGGHRRIRQGASFESFAREAGDARRVWQSVGRYGGDPSSKGWGTNFCTPGDMAMQVLEK
ncbi:hypothetical protein HDU96_010611, partial [Phlyctochytrium bullatum]